MKTKKIMIALMLLTTGTAWAEDFPKDSLKIVDIEEVVVKIGRASCRERV